VSHDKFRANGRVHSSIGAVISASVVYVAILYEKELAAAVTCALRKLQVSIASFSVISYKILGPPSSCGFPVEKDDNFFAK